MEHVCFVLPILPGKSEAARAMQREMDTTRKPDYARSEQRMGIKREYWFLAPLPSGDHLVAYFEVPNLGEAIGIFVASSDPFDVWCKAQLADVTGIDFANLPPAMKLPELVSSYEA